MLSAADQMVLHLSATVGSIRCLNQRRARPNHLVRLPQESIWLRLKISLWVALQRLFPFQDGYGGAYVARLFLTRITVGCARVSILIPPTAVIVT